MGRGRNGNSRAVRVSKGGSRCIYGRFATKQSPAEPTDLFIYKKRALFTQLKPPHAEKTELDMIYGLLTLNVRRVIERSEG